MIIVREEFPNTDLYLLWSLFSRILTELVHIQSEKKKIRTRKNSLFEHFPRSVISPSTYSILDIYMGNTFECLIWQRCRQKPKIFSTVLSWFQELLFSGLVHSIDFKASNIKNRNKSNLIIFFTLIYDIHSLKMLWVERKRTKLKLKCLLFLKN